MADRRRRRKLASNDDSEDCSEESDDEQSGLRKSLTGSDGGDSEYESADEEELGDEEEEDDDELILMPDGLGVPGEDNKPLDDDEDRKNPQYIPKKGTFYEHDDRTAEDDAEKPVPEEPVVKKETAKKKVWKEDDRWNHDKFNEFDQAPKSREELIAIYGYDIRNEEGPPRARRRRRYGRGPNKYTRNWEDLDAYAKPTRGGTVRGGIGRGGNRSWTGSRKTLENDEEFPALNSSLQNSKQLMDDPQAEQNIPNSESPRTDQQRPIHDDQILGNTDGHKQQQPHQSPQQQHHQKNSIASPQIQDVRMENPGRGRGGRGRGRGAGRGNNRHNDERSHNYQDGRPAGRGGRGGHQQRPPQQHPSHGPRDMEELAVDMKNISVSAQNREEQFRGKNRGGGNSDNRRNMVPPRLQESAAAAASAQGRGNRGGNASPGGDGSASRPKRYSSQRQRSIPDQPVPPFQQQPNYIDPAMEPEPFLGRPPAPRPFPPVTQSPHLYGPPVAPPVAGPPVGAPPPLGAPPVGAPPVPGPPVTGPPFLPPENMINYGAHPGPHPGPLPGAAPLAGPHPPQFPPFQGFTPGTVSQPGEIYSNGVTYYNTQSQQHIPRINLPLQKRPKAAIPIVPPPERESRKEGGAAQDAAGGTRQDEQGLEQSEQELNPEVAHQEADNPKEGHQEPEKIQEEPASVEKMEATVPSPEAPQDQQEDTKEKESSKTVDNHLEDSKPEATSQQETSEAKPPVDTPVTETAAVPEKEVKAPVVESKPAEQNTSSEELQSPPPVSETPDTAVAAS
ncbi:protein CASC3-like isoform X3 [Penaeus japonicus]|uniref:protein CASC3-like isoform X3 n=1 Tax=Penaeus japonicus TaxID=27405 RepID=UPI001C70DDB5|nr:protein CASC3-like isoform X3 [Penaeus japonicus]